MNPTVKVPTASDLQVHDLLIETDPDNHPTDCWICKAQRPGGDGVDTVEDTVDLEAQIAQLQADRAARDTELSQLRDQLAARDTDARIADLEAKVADAEAKVADAEAKVADAEAKVQVAEANTAAVQQAFDTYKAEIEALADADAAEAARVARGEARKSAVLALGYDARKAEDATDRFITDVRVETWSNMDDATWDTVFAALESAKPAPGETRDPVGRKAAVDTGTGTSLGGGSTTDTEGELTSSQMTRNILANSGVAKHL